MDHAGPIPMVNDFGGMTPDANFLNQPNGPPNGPGGPGSGGGPGGGNGGGNSGGSVGGGPEHLLSGGSRGGGSPEFMSSGNFSEPQNMQNEGLVW